MWHKTIALKLNAAEQKTKKKNAAATTTTVISMLSILFSFVL